MTADYRYPISQCDVDVSGHAALEAFREKRRSWVMWVHDDEHHAISKTLQSMVWREVAISTLSKLATDDATSALNNSLLSEALVDGHVAMQLLAIRRLADGTKNVKSLPKLIADLKRNVQLFTRQNYVCFDGLPYDFEKVERETWQGRDRSGVFWEETSGPRAYGRSERLHAHFDKLAGISDPASRMRNDRLPSSLLTTIEGWLEDSDLEGLMKWCHAFLAHAGSEQSRRGIAEFQLTSPKITKAIRILARATEAISGCFLYVGGLRGNLMPTAHCVLENLDSPAVRPDAEDGALAHWDKRSAEWDECLEGVESELIVRNTEH